jgi:rhamnosyltransferase
MAITTLSIVIRALNEAEHLPHLLDGIKTQTRQPHEVVLVDSGSTDATVQIARDHGARITHITPEDFSFGRALNVGCGAAQGDVLVFASAHVRPVDDRWLEHLTDAFSHDDVALSYGRQVGDERTKLSEQRVMARWFPESSDMDQSHPFSNNANCAVRASVWRELPYDETLTGLEDLDWANRAQALGHRLVYRADAPVVHVHEESYTGIVNRYRREAVAYRKIFADQRMTGPEAFGLFFANASQDIAAAFRDPPGLRDLAWVPAFRAAQFWGTYKGFRQLGPISSELKKRFYYPDTTDRQKSAT